MKLAVIFPVRNCLDMTKAAVASVWSIHEPQIYVVDHFSNQDMKDWLASRDDIVSIIDPPNTTGLSFNWNLAIHRALSDGCDTFAVLNNDIVLHPQTIDTLVERLQKGDVVMATGVNVAGHTTPADIFTYEPGEATENEHPDFSCFVIDKRFIEKIGWFDSGYVGAYMEDCDTHARIALANEKAVCCNNAPYYHYASGTIRNNPQLANEIGNKHDLNKIYFQKKWGCDHVNDVEDMRKVYFKTPWNEPGLTIKDTSRPLIAVKKDKIKVLWLSDFNCATGFAQVAQNLVKMLIQSDLYEIDIVGINHSGEPYDHEKWPLNLYPAIRLDSENPAHRDLFGRQRVLDFLGTGKYDILFTLQDTFILSTIGGQIAETRELLRRNGGKTFKWICYFPIDGIPHKDWLDGVLQYCDYPVTYTEFARKEVAKFGYKAEVIYHGVDLDTFHPISHEEREDFRNNLLKLRTGTFLVTNVNRNQRRKDIPRTVEAFARFHEKVPLSALYLHMKVSDLGGDVNAMAANFGLEPGKDVITPVNFSERNGFPVEFVNKVYCASDVVISTTVGEGWGLSSTEAMATKTPILFPDHTALTEICEGRARLIKTKGQICFGHEDFNQFRPLTDVDDLVDALCDVHASKEVYADFAEKAHEWVQHLSWPVIGSQWLSVFAKASIKNPPKYNLERSQIAI